MDTINPISHQVRKALENLCNHNSKYHIRIQKCKIVDNNMEIYIKNNQDSRRKYQDNLNNSIVLHQEDRINWMYVNFK